MESQLTPQPSGSPGADAACLSTSDAQQSSQPQERPEAEPLRNSRPFAVAKLVLGLLSLVFAIFPLVLILVSGTQYLLWTFQFTFHFALVRFLPSSAVDLCFYTIFHLNAQTV